MKSPNYKNHNYSKQTPRFLVLIYKLNLYKYNINKEKRLSQHRHAVHIVNGALGTRTPDRPVMSRML